MKVLYKGVPHLITEVDEGGNGYGIRDCNENPNEPETLGIKWVRKSDVQEYIPETKENETYKAVAEQIGALVDEKNKAYGDSFNKCGEFLSMLYPNGIEKEQYTDMLGLVRVFDKMMRIANQKDAFGENPWKDICGYSILRTKG